MLRRAICKPTGPILQSRGIAYASLKEVKLRGAPIDVHPEVQDALATGKPVVALETTIVTHGMPYPTNIDTARSLERIVRDNQAVPATIGLISGRVKIGLEPFELERLADVDRNSGVVKVSRRDIAPTISLKKDGGTTCSATLIFAALAGIKVFSTGGLGGVHRGGESTMDVSADLQELTKCPVGLVSAGVKSILDIGRTLEYLETLGVPVVSYGPTNDFPAFYTRQSGFNSPWRVDNPTDAAHILKTQERLGMTNGALFAVPIPEEYEAVGQTLQAAVEQAIYESEAKGINRRGKEATPWLLKRVGELTEGKSLASNIALIENTTRVGSQIAKAYTNLSQDGSSRTFTPAVDDDKVNSMNTMTVETMLQLEHSAQESSDHGVLAVVGSSAVDVTAQAKQSDSTLALHSTVPGSVSVSLGGVGRNMAEAAHRLLTAFSSNLAQTTTLISPIGQDAFGKMLISESKGIGMRTDGFIEIDGRTAVCNMVLDGAGCLIGGIADMDIAHNFDSQLALNALRRVKPSIVALDGNLSEDSLSAVVQFCCQQNIPVFFEPTSVVKSSRIMKSIAVTLGKTRTPVSYTSPNLVELAAMYQAAREADLTTSDIWWSEVDNMGVGSEFRMSLNQLSRLNDPSMEFLVKDGVAQMAIHLLPFFRHIIIKCGEFGVIVVFRAKEGSAWAKEQTNIFARQVTSQCSSGEKLVLKHFPAHMVDTVSIVNVTGAGDTLVGAILSSLVQDRDCFDDDTKLDATVHKAQAVRPLPPQPK
ncbi:hypothetical protein K474DRAFT_1655667 [Panus rudis PR-1116 ss-1]|nr:hypothetical protein K474DRAFT_1655667 [Panus rudis PR-1116 ss-1]